MLCSFFVSDLKILYYNKKIFDYNALNKINILRHNLFGDKIIQNCFKTYWYDNGFVWFVGFYGI